MKQGVACIALRDHPEAPVLLLLRAFGEFRDEWCFVAGHARTGEDPADAAARELREETGLSGQLSPLLVSHASPDLTLHVFVARVPDRAIELDSEHSEAKWLSFEAAKELLPLPEQREALMAARRAVSDGIVGYWSRYLGVPTSALQRPGVIVTPHAELGDYRGIWFFVRGDSAVVSAPADWVTRLQEKCGSAAAEELLSPTSARRWLGSAAGRIIGPSFQGWLPKEDFLPVAADGVRCLAESDAEHLRVFEAACSPEEWEHGGIDPARAEVWASFQGAHAVALGQLRSRPGNAVDPSIITHPRHRGDGHGVRLVGTLVESALQADKLVLYQTLMSNGPSISLARHLGFDHYATLLAVRLEPA